MFVNEYLEQSIRLPPMAAAAFLAVGTEGIVSRVYEIMQTGLRRAGIPDAELEVFAIHIACDDDHAATPCAPATPCWCRGGRCPDARRRRRQAGQA
jgi:hypothetical protein